MKYSILSIGYGRHLFDPQNAERKRLAACAQETAGLHMVVFSLRSHEVQALHEDQLYLYPTRSRSAVLMPYDAIRLGLRIMRAKRDAAWCITSQDPVASGIIGYILNLLTRAPFIVQEHGDIFSGNYWRQESYKNRLLYPVARFILARASRVRVVGERVKRHVVALGVPESRIRILPVFSDLSAIRTAPIRTDLRIAHPHASVIVLSVARFVPQKNLSLLLRAFKPLSLKDPAAILVLVGAGAEEQSLKKEASDLGLAESVTWMPWSNDVTSLMKSADIYALSSNYEGWARVLVEAMACGLPCVTTDVGCAGEVFLDARHGLVVPVGDEAAFASALIKLSTDADLHRSFVQAGIEDSARMADTIALDHATYAKRWAEVYEGI